MSQRFVCAAVAGRFIGAAAGAAAGVVGLAASAGAASGQLNQPFPAVFELSSLQATGGALGFVINGIDADDDSGWSVSSAGDVNGDGVDDLLIGAYGADPNGNSQAGETYVVFGGPGVGASGPGALGTFELSLLDGTNGFVLRGIDSGDLSGWSVSSAGDVNGDGVADLLIGALNADSNGDSQAGESYVVFGGPGVGASGAVELSSLNGASGFVINGIDAGDRSGFSVSSAGDVNSDGVADLLIGARLADPNGNLQAGESYVVFGGSSVGSSGVLELSSLNGVNGFVINGIDANDKSGLSVSSAGDVNADGVSDLLIGAPGGGPNGNSLAGESYVVFGRDPDPCSVADVNSDGFVTPADLNAWVAAFNAGGLDCDQNGDLLCTPADFNAWVLNFNSGC